MKKKLYTSDLHPGDMVLLPRGSCFLVVSLVTTSSGGAVLTWLRYGDYDYIDGAPEFHGIYVRTYVWDSYVGSDNTVLRNGKVLQVPSP